MIQTTDRDTIQTAEQAEQEQVVQAEERTNKRELNKQQQQAKEQKEQEQISFDSGFTALGQAVIQKNIWPIMTGGILDPLTFVPATLVFDIYWLVSFLVGFISEDLAKKFPKLSFGQLGFLLGANIVLLILIFLLIIMITAIICAVSPTDCPIPWTEIIKSYFKTQGTTIPSA